MKKMLLLCLLLLASAPARALTLDFIYPNGEGDAQAAQPYLDAFYAYVTSKSGVAVSGTYYNDADEAVAALKTGKVSLAVVAPDFNDAQAAKFGFDVIARTIPIYASRAYEKYYLFCGPDMNPAQLSGKRPPVAVYASRPYTQELVEAVLQSDADTRNLITTLKPTPEFLTAMRNVAQKKDTAFLFLNGYEHSVWEKLKSADVDFAALKLAAASAEMPSSALVALKGAPREDVAKIKTAVLAMGKDPAAKKILNDLRLNGFAP